MQNDYDVLINGAGMVGGTIACILAASGMRVVVLDREAPSVQVADSYDGRASAIALGSQRVLDGAGLWEFLHEVASPILDIRVSDQQSPLSLHYDHRDFAVTPNNDGDGSGNPLGFMVENRHFRVALARAIEKLKNLTVLAPGQVVAIERDSHKVSATLDSGRVITADLVVGSDGRGSIIRRLAGIALTRHDYGQSGIVCTVDHEHPHQQVAYERFLATGPFAILPLLGNRSSIVWAEKTDLADHIMSLSDREFQEELARRFGSFLGTVTPTGPRWCYPLSLQYTGYSIDNRLVLAGDACHGMHPLAGQGLNMGLRDAAALGEVLIDAHRLGLDVGRHSVLDRYQRWRRFDNGLMMGATHMINAVFSNSIEPLRLARVLGLAVVDVIPPLKKQFMLQAMGLSGDLPKLMRGQPI